MRSFFVSSVAFGLFFLFGFAQLFPHQALALTNSVPALSDDYGYNVWIRTEALDDQGDSAPAYCNGSLLDARTLVTAAHCFQYAYQLGSHELRITLGKYKYVTKPNGTVVRIGYVTQPDQIVQARFVFLPSVASRLAEDPSSAGSVSVGPDEDIAIATWDAPLNLADDFKFAEPLSPAEFDSVKDSLEQFQPMVLAVNPVAWCTTTDTKRIALLDSVSWSDGYIESKSSAQLEEGDSGAPLLVTYQGRQKLAGVVKGHGHSLFWSWDALAPLGSQLCTLEQQAQMSPVSAGCGQ